MMEKDHIQPEHFKDESSSCQCTTTLIGARTAMNKFVKAIPQIVPIMPENFPKDIGHSSDLDLKKNGTERTLTNQTVRGTMWLN